MAWKPFVQERSFAIQAFKQAIIDERGYLFSKFKDSRLRQKTLLQKLKMGRLGLSSNYHEIVRKNLAIVYLGYASYLNLFETGVTELSGGWLKVRERLNQDGFRVLSEYHFFAIEYIDTSAFDALAKKLGIDDATLAALRIAAPAVAEKALAGALDTLGLTKADMLNNGVQPIYQIAEGLHDVREKMHPKLSEKMGFGAGELFERVGKQQQTNLKSLAPSNQPSYGHGEAGGLRMGLTDNYGPKGVNILNWQLLCVQQTTIAKVSNSPVMCNSLSSICAGSIEWESIARVVNSWERLNGHPPRIFARSTRSYWRTSGKTELTYYDGQGESDKMLDNNKYEEWIPFGMEGPRRAIISALPELPDGTGPIADLDLPHD